MCVNLGDQAAKLAEAAGTSVEVVKTAAAALDATFAGALTNSFGLIGDKLAYHRLVKFVELHQKTEEKLAKRGVKLKPLTLPVGLPLIEYAMAEDDPTLSERWSNLLANARDADYDSKIRRSYSHILSQMDPIDCEIFEYVAKIKSNSDLDWNNNTKRALL
jgi:hypothetical protein